jgi:hypothetical protein
MIWKDRCPDCAYPVPALSIIYFYNPATKVQDQACRSSLSQTDLENALEAHRERYYREELMASWCAIDDGGLWRARFHVADAAQVAAPKERHRGSGSALRTSAETGPSLPLPAAVVCAKLRRCRVRWAIGILRAVLVSLVAWFVEGLEGGFTPPAPAHLVSQRAPSILTFLQQYDPERGMAYSFCLHLVHIIPGMCLLHLTAR